MRIIMQIVCFFSSRSTLAHTHIEIIGLRNPKNVLSTAN